MTKSAKQDTTAGPAETAETESATAGASADSAPDAKPEATAKPEAAASRSPPSRSRGQAGG